MKEYLKLIKTVLKKGVRKTNRTGIDTISYFGYQMRYDLSKGFPIITTKEVHFKSVVGELLWFLNGDTNLKYLIDNKIRIWNEWGYERYKLSNEYNGEDQEAYIKLIKTNPEFANKYGDLGPIYGRQWRNFNGIDQIKYLISELKSNPNSRRLVLSSWNPKELDEMALPPCHLLFQLYCVDNKLSLQLYQRSADIFLGVPFNISSYCLLLHLLALECNLDVGEFVHTIGDAHIYANHLDQIKLQLKRKPKKLPNLVIIKKDIFNYSIEDIKLENYNHHPKIKGIVAV